MYEKGVATMCKIMEDLIDNEKKEIAEVLGLSVEVVNTLNEENKAVVS